MTEYKERKSNLEEFPHPVMVSFKTNLMDKFYDLVGKGMKDVGAHFFGHTLIKNHRQEGHTVSSFITNLDWQEKYWNNYWDCDSVHSTSYPIAEINGTSIVSWRVVDPNNDCMEDRKTMCNTKDGFRFDIHHKNGVLENFSFGWEKYNINRVNRKKLEKLSNMVTDFRIQHFLLNSDMFDVYPPVEFH